MMAGNNCGVSPTASAMENKSESSTGLWKNTLKAKMLSTSTKERSVWTGGANSRRNRNGSSAVGGCFCAGLEGESRRNGGGEKWSVGVVEEWNKELWAEAGRRRKGVLECWRDRR